MSRDANPMIWLAKSLARRLSNRFSEGVEEAR